MVIYRTFLVNRTTHIETPVQGTYTKSGTYSFCNQTTSAMSSDPVCSPTNVSTPELPPEMQFGSQNIISVAAYSCFFLIAACGNLTVFITLFRNRKIKSRVNLFILHLSVADLIVTFIMMPLEIGWHTTVSWRAGDLGCRVLMFFRTFGLYLSSFVLVTISLDRYFAILHPLSLNDADRRGKIMLAFAWIFSAVASIPQTIFQFSVSVFALCWTPYFVVSAWWWFDRETAKNLDGRVQKGLFMFAVSNSCMNPIVYGIFTIKFKREFMRCCCCMRTNFRQMKNMAFTSVGNYVAWQGQHVHNSSPLTVPIPDKARKTYSPKLLRSLPGRFGTLSETSATSSANDVDTLSNHTRSDSRANINNFMTVQFSTEDRNESKSV
ncbi:hypothetical protein ACJMK2_043727 [Sinanodonta woodiana]|uniref:G-protein coupled receptors family 1 profile domain-containing protein n=1 Tax=Sinanodonta woodiana TaxID=1069815 RepID=A0ABD3VYL7_SINWO